MSCFKDDTPFRVHVINLNVGACWSHIWSKGWSLFKRKHHLMTCTDSRTQQRTCAEKPIQNSPVHKVPIPPLTRQDMQIEESSRKDDCPVPSRSRTCRCTWLPKPTKQGWRTSLCPAKMGTPSFCSLIPAVFINSQSVGNPWVWRFPTFGHCPTGPPDSASHAGDEETTTKWQENMIPNVLKFTPQLRNHHQRKHVKRNITACDHQQVQNAGCALWIEKFPEHIGHNQSQRGYHEQADQGCSQAPTQNYSFNSSAGVGSCAQDEPKTFKKVSSLLVPMHPTDKYIIVNLDHQPQWVWTSPAKNVWNEQTWDFSSYPFLYIWSLRQCSWATRSSAPKTETCWFWAFSRNCCKSRNQSKLWPRSWNQLMLGPICLSYTEAKSWAQSKTMTWQWNSVRT